MTERTFRSPSPNRASEAVPPDADAPPVPLLPQGYVSPPSIPAKSIKRPASVEPPQRMLSPPPKAHGRGVSLDRGPGMLANTTPRPRQPRVPAIKATEDPNSARKRDSINFSRPMSPTNSPKGSPAIKRPTSAMGNMEANNAGTASPLNPASPPRKKKAAANSTPNSNQSAATAAVSGLNPVDFTPLKQMSAGGPSQPQQKSSPPTNLNVPPTATPKKKKKKIVSPSPSSDLNNSYPSDNESVTSERSTTSEVSRPYNTRAAGVLAKRPSVVREDREAEEEEDASPFTKRSDLSPAGEEAKPRYKAKATRKRSGDQQHGRSASQPVNVTKPKTSSLGVPNGRVQELAKDSDLGSSSNRPQSLSPARSAHFSMTPVTGGEKHQPPARSVSPAKSALKHSPSRGNSPVPNVQGTTMRRVGPGSEASDRSSLVSEDGKLMSKPKRSVRVSFDEDSVVLGRAATPPTDTDSPVIISPQDKGSPKKWFSGRRDKKTSSDEDGSIQPTPALPSFGSIRRNKDANVPGDEKQKTGFSSDEKVGAILSRVFSDQAKDSDIESRKQLVTSDPIPPQVTSIEGDGQHSESEYSTQDPANEGKLLEQPQVSLPLTSDEGSFSKDVLAAVQEVEPSVEVPQISVQPATPGLGENNQDPEDYVGVDNKAAPDDQQSALPLAEHAPTESTPAGLGIAEPTPESIHAANEPSSPVVGQVAETIRKQTDPDTESDESAVFSDAAEDMSDLEGDGYGSINAIVESPASVSSPFAKQTMPGSPTSKVARSKEGPQPSPLGKTEGSPTSSPGSDADWDKAQSYWSDVKKTRKEQGPAQSGAPPTAVAPQQPKKKVKKRTQQAAAPSQPPLPPWPDRQYQEDITRSASPKAGAMKKSMRPKSPEIGDPPMRSTLRNSAPPKSALKQSPQPATALTPASAGARPMKSRPISAAPITQTKPRAPIAGHNRISSLESAPPTLPSTTKKTTKPKPNTMLSRNDSDSSSSFRKVRSKTPDSGRYAMRRSMRGDTSTPRPSTTYGGSEPNQAINRRPMSVSGPPNTMRTSLRGSVDIKPTRTSLRSSIDSKPERTKSPSRFPGFGRKKDKHPAAASTAGSRFSSRFGDSSDEDDGRSFTRSRFADSSDEDEVEAMDLTPVRGIPKRIDEGDSTDLEDSSADEAARRTTAIAKTPEAATSATSAHPATAAEGAALGNGSLRPAGPLLENQTPEPKKKRPFFSRIGSKRKESASPAAQPVSLASRLAAPQPSGPTPRLTSKPSPSIDTNAASAASAAAASPKSPKLQRRVTAERAASLQARAANAPGSQPPSSLTTIEQAKKVDPSSWPLPPNTTNAETSSLKGRPSTSDGTTGPRRKFGGGLGEREAGKEKLAIREGGKKNNKRPEMGERRATVDVEGNILSAKTGRKKRFQGLRRLVGLND